jgi:hypothetical protein
VILRQNIHVNVALVVVTESVFYVFCSRKREVTKPLFIIYRLLKFLCVFCLSCVVYIYKTLEELEIERSRKTEKRRVLKLAA